MSEYIQEFVLSETQLYFSSKNLCLKDNNKTAHWVGHLKRQSMYIEYLKKKICAINKEHISDVTSTKTNNDDISIDKISQHCTTDK